jgi:ubiquinone/menaquinone biosynthesis C-methylase UbiE
MDQPSPLDFRVSREEISSAFEPFVHHHFHASDISWKRQVFRLWRKQFGDYVKLKMFSDLKKSGGGAQQDVKVAYEKFYGETILSEHLSREGRVIPCRWGDDRMLARGIGTKRVHHMLLKRAIETVKPERVLEVGSGYGINLFVLAGYFPNIQFSGIELTEQGVLAAKRIGDMTSMPKEIIQFSPDNLADVMAHQRVKFFQGSAIKLPFPDNSFDVLYTVLALEAMEEIRHQALRELARVAKKYVIMIEPFLNFNDRGIRYYYHTSHQYFRGKIDELQQDGLDPVVVYSDIPHKLRLWPALVIARPT